MFVGFYLQYATNFKVIITLLATGYTKSKTTVKKSGFEIRPTVLMSAAF